MVDYICPKEAIFLFEILKSIEIISHSFEKRHVLSTLQGIFSLTNKIKPPPNLFRSLRNILYPFTWNSWSGKYQSVCFKKIKHVKFSEKQTFPTPWYLLPTNCSLFDKSVYSSQTMLKNPLSFYSSCFYLVFSSFW